MNDTDTTPWGPSEFLKSAYFALVQAYDALRAEGQPDAARPALALAKQTERLHGRVIQIDNADTDTLAAMLDVAARAWGE